MAKIVARVVGRRLRTFWETNYVGGMTFGHLIVAKKMLYDSHGLSIFLFNSFRFLVELSFFPNPKSHPLCTSLLNIVGFIFVYLIRIRVAKKA